MTSLFRLCTVLLLGSGFALQLAADDFSISAAPSAQSVWQGQSTSYLLTLTVNGGFSGQVSFSATALPSGVTAGFSPATLAGSATSTMNLAVSPGTAVGSYTIGVSATSGSETESASVTTNIVVPPPIQYTYDALGRLTSVTDQFGASATYAYDAVGNVLSIARHAVNQLSIVAFSPSHGIAGAAVTIVGSGFAPVAQQNTVSFNGAAATVVSATSTQLVATVPAAAMSGPVAISNALGSATSSSPFTIDQVAANPVITSFSPAIAQQGTPVTITGSGLIPSPTVSIGGRSIPVQSATAAAVTIVIPPACGSGKITLQTPNGQTTSSADFYSVPIPYAAADVVSATRVSANTTSTTKFSGGSQVSLVIFEGVAGQTSSLFLNSSTQNQTVAVYAPDGSLVLPDTQLNGNSATIIDLPSLPTAGTYTVAVKDDPAWFGTVSLIWTPVPDSDFVISAIPDFFRNSPSGTAFHIFVRMGASNTDDVTLSVTGLPSGITAHVSYNPLGNSPNSIYSQLTFTIAGSVAASTYPFTLVGAGTGSGTHAFPLSIVVDPLPSPWHGIDIDTSNGGSEYANGTFTLHGWGDDQDAMRLAYQTLSGDGAVVARVVSAESEIGWGGTAPTALGGITIRNSLTDVARIFSVRLNTAVGAETVWRANSGGGPFSETASTGLAAPYWLKIVRQGNTFVGFTSGDGTTWTQIATPVTISMASSVYVGLTTASNTGVARIVFDNVSISNAADFSVYAAQPSKSIVPGGTATYSVNVAALSGFSGSVSLNVAGLPAGATATIAPSSLAAPGTATLTITTTANTPVGMYSIPITATSGALSHVLSVGLNVAAPDFSLSLDSASQAASVNTTVTYNVTANFLNGLQTPVSFSVTGLPRGATATFSPSTLSSSGTSALNISIAANTPGRDYTVVIIAAAGALKHTISAVLSVIKPDFSLTLDQSILTVPPAGGSVSANVTVNGSDNFSRDRPTFR